MAAALRVFADKGFAEATNREIASQAGIRSPGLIYHYFPSKLDLLRSILEDRSELSQIVENTEWLLSQPPEITLPYIGKLYVRLYEDPESRQLLKVVFGEALRNEEFATAFAQFGPLRMIALLTHYFEGLMKKGVLRSINPATAARAFLGPFAILLVFRTVFDPENHHIPDLENLVSNNVQIFLQGLAVYPT